LFIVQSANIPLLPMSSQAISSRTFRPFHLKPQGPIPEQETLLWVSASPNLKYFDLPLLQALSQSHAVARWEYQQHCDEASSLEEAVNLLVGYIQQCDRPIHLAGHGISGVMAMMAADRIPESVRSLSIFGVAPQPGLTWQAHYYLQRLTLPCSQTRVLAQMCRSLFGSQMPHSISTLVRLFARDLSTSPSPHSLFKIAKIPPVQTKVPLLVCNGALDFVISPEVAQCWQSLTKPGDRIVMIPEGQHFFHYQFSEQVAREMTQFWSQFSLPTPVYSP
jgi:pimeloyl-ACP methyl ester carboxylesterase